MQKLILFKLMLLLCFAPVYAADEAEEEATAASSAYISLGEPLVLNLSGKNRNTFLQISADVLINDDSEELEIKNHIPAMRHSVIMKLSEQKASDIKSPGKREEIRQELATEVKQVVADLSGIEIVSDILFSSILVQ
ncbi:MAG: flagellar basal body-associated FliL family protein [Pseudomonadota bacterium]